jgi:protein tyrosine phosphatase (PTP) superfamily phosphohydrolase (DUF442 family)
MVKGHHPEGRGMSQRIEIEDGLIVDTSQPSREELDQLAPEGLKAVANLRMPGEQNQPLSPEEEGEVPAGGDDLRTRSGRQHRPAARAG